MSGPTHDRRAHQRLPRTRPIQVLVDERAFPAVLTDISSAGLQARVDPVTFDEIREGIEAVRFDSGPPLLIRMEWGFFDGTFGASFKDRYMAEAIVEHYLAPGR